MFPQIKIMPLSMERRKPLQIYFTLYQMFIDQNNLNKPDNNLTVHIPLCIDHWT